MLATFVPIEVYYVMLKMQLTVLDRCGRSGHGWCLGDSLFAVVVQAVFCLDPLFDAVVLSQILILLLFLVRGERVVETDRRSNDFLTLLLTRFLKKKQLSLLTVMHHS